jgi:malonyl-CoA O-methyltransferase
MTKPAAHAALPAKRASRAVFERAGSTFAAASVVHDWARQRLLERLAYVDLDPSVVVDLGCATGAGTIELAARFPRAVAVAVDTSLAMLAAARDAADAATRIYVAAGDAEKMPLPAGSVGLLLANLVLPWCVPELVFREAARVLAPGGSLMFATLGPDTLQEVRRAWAQADDGIHVHAAFEMHDLGDIAVASGLQEPVMDIERIRLTYAHVRDLVRDLRACGAVNTAAGRRPTLTGPERWRAFVEALHAGRRDARFDVTSELVFGQAWGSPGASRQGRSSDEVIIPVDRIGGRDR